MRLALQQPIFETAFRKTRTPMVFADPTQPDCPIVEANAAFSTQTGYANDEVLGRNCRFLQGPDTDPAAVARIRSAIRERRAITEELYNYRRDGSGFWNALHISPVFAEDGALLYFFASQIDVSEHREMIRRQSRRIESIGALSSGVAHEFNNLMTVILGSVELATARVADDLQRRHLERAGWGAQRAGMLAGQLLSLSSRQESHDRALDLNQAMRDMADRLARNFGPRMPIELALQAAPAPVRLDPDQLERVMVELIRNAVDAMPAGGRIVIRTARLTLAEETQLFNGQGAVELVIEDEGPGMLPEVVERATELFFTTKDAALSSGVGLFVALDFVDKAGGRMQIDSRPGAGTRIRLLFPFSRD